MLGTLLRRGALIVLGLAAALLAAEVLLQAGAAYRRWSGTRPELAVGEGTRILCVGDSHTYGLYLEPDQSYPGQLQRLLGDGVQVVNLGFPGMNSSRLRAELPAMLDAIHPSVVFILIGVNDLWTAPVPVDAAAARAESWSSWLYRRFRVYRLLYILVSGIGLQEQGAQPVVMPRVSMESTATIDGQEAEARYGDHTFKLGWQPVSKDHPPQAAEQADNLARIVEEVRQHGAEPVVLTYPSDHNVYQKVSAAIAERARRAGAPLIDLNAQFKEQCAAGGCATLFFGDGHPTEPGYRQMAEILAAWLRQQEAPAATR
jgi:lysophospholipase L1-like esterase